VKKPVKITLWAVSIVLALLIIAAIVFFINFRQATKTMSPAETGQINDSVWCIKDRFVNAYLFKGDNHFLMVDAGMSRKKVRNELDKIGISPDNITTLLLTHTDGDHIGGVGLLKNAAVYMHRDEEQMINGTTGKTKLSKTVWKYGPYFLLNDNDTFQVDGLKIKIIHTPGHTPGSSCYIIGNDYLVTGDNLLLVNNNYVQFTEMFNMNTPEQLKSLKLLPDPDSFKYILTGHNGVVEVSK